MDVADSDLLQKRAGITLEFCLLCRRGNPERKVSCLTLLREKCLMMVWYNRVLGQLGENYSIKYMYTVPTVEELSGVNLSSAVLLSMTNTKQSFPAHTTDTFFFKCRAIIYYGLYIRDLKLVH